MIILVLAKAPVPGRVKTRLCPPATPEQAADIAAASLLDTLDVVCSVPGARPVVSFAGEIGCAARQKDLVKALNRTAVFWQRGQDFANRLANAHLDVARHCPGQAVLQIGMDTPQVTPAILTGAMERLKEFDGVLGRAADGGWWALGLHNPAEADALRTVRMSRPDTGDLTHAALAHLRIGELPVLSDVDTMADARQVARQVPNGRFAQTVVATA
ncbi:DUF2064 domain-containing protein [Actinocrispum sp. NPDC049592]|uniref:TIGR04282 family arsenosugar biosynthesis glycosyltransferase n=1 Tax=Actinocrispum sp. NPDC049592 TaxID=3154835 RepID=UPI00341D9CDF